MEALDIPLTGFALLYLLLLLPLYLLRRLKLGLGREVLISVVRMSVQLFLVGIYLKYLFAVNSLLLNVLWIMVIMVVANLNILKKAGLAVTKLFWPSLAGVACGTLVVLGIFLLLVVRPTPLYDARYMIPLAGMLLGNCMNGNILSLERFYSGLRKDESTFLTYLLMGATLKEAVHPFMREAIRSSLAPTIASMMTIGIVSLPGMMTGQILGGSFPLVAIKYQIMIMIGIFSSLVISMVASLYLSLPFAFDSMLMLKDEIFAAKKKG
ncbi:MAG: iron export ABC transporter permease subunit FetB [Proteobacteria bacterium]|nr:iron export ABC transporter permease subunit FetB [Pseudomonadota bacterium]MBU1648279.1 iron export ABC transporter permease subunit FetB [Pseudomonadota bacterium]